MRFVGDASELEDNCTSSSHTDSDDSLQLLGGSCSDSSVSSGGGGSIPHRPPRSGCYHLQHSHAVSRSVNIARGGGSGSMAAHASTPLLAARSRVDLEREYQQDSSCYTSIIGDEKCSSGASEVADKKKQSSIVTIFAVWNTIMGSSLLTMAWGVERAGLAAALLLMVFMGALCLYTAYILLRVRAHHGLEPPLEVHELCRALLGRWAELAARGFSLLVMLGANIVYWILMTNFLYYTVNYFVDLNASNSTETHNGTLLCPKQFSLHNSSLLGSGSRPAAAQGYWGLRTTAPLLIALLIFPLLNFKNATFFTKFNSLGTLAVVYLVVFVGVKGAGWGAHVASWGGELRAGRGAAALSGMLALSFYIHNIIITIMSHNSRQENNGRDLTISFALVTLTYILVGAVFYICFPLAKYCIEDNILNNFEMHDAMSAAARILLLFQVVTVYPLVAYMFRAQTLSLLPRGRAGPRILAINLALVAVCILFACFCPNVGTIIRYTGAVSGLVHIFTLPSLLQIRSLQLRGRLVWWKTLFYLAITLVGAVNLLAQFFINE